MSNEAIMEELRTTEGMIFKDEGAKKLFLDIKSIVFDSLQTKFVLYDSDTYASHLKSYVLWYDDIGSEELTRAQNLYPDMKDRVVKVTILYAKYIFANSNDSNEVNIEKPTLESFIKGMYTRACRTKSIRNGTFFDLDPLKQDFVFRDFFRQTLGNDCIKVSEVEEFKTEPLKEEDEIYPDDSISRVMAGETKIDDDNKSSLSATSKVSEFRKPFNLVRKVFVEEP